MRNTESPSLWHLLSPHPFPSFYPFFPFLPFLPFLLHTSPPLVRPPSSCPHHTLCSPVSVASATLSLPPISHGACPDPAGVGGAGGAGGGIASPHLMLPLHDPSLPRGSAWQVVTNLLFNITTSFPCNAHLTCLPCAYLPGGDEPPFQHHHGPSAPLPAPRPPRLHRRLHAAGEVR
ncbi:unnamed protein product [Closterium sp. NIES-53]